MAVIRNHVATMRVLLAAGADPNSGLALHEAAASNKAGAIRALFEAGADIDGPS
ncbi:unnamed protein product, partial [Ectocarpus sp. 8 AP-2014]